MKESLKSAGYKHIGFIGHGQHVLQPVDGGAAEVWFSNKNHASYGIIYKNTHLEFAHTASDREKLEAVL